MMTKYYLKSSSPIFSLAQLDFGPRFRIFDKKCRLWIEICDLRRKFWRKFSIVDRNFHQYFRFWIKIIAIYRFLTKKVRFLIKTIGFFTILAQYFNFDVRSEFRLLANIWIFDHSFPIFEPDFVSPKNLNFRRKS